MFKITRRIPCIQHHIYLKINNEKFFAIPFLYNINRYQSNDSFSKAQNILVPELKDLSDKSLDKSFLNILENSNTLHARPLTSFEIEQPGLIDASATDIASPLLESTVNALGEPALATYGLGNFTPPGIIQNFLEYLHADIGLPWWGAIVATTVMFRFLLFPIMIKSQKYSIKMGNVMPTIQRYQTELYQARKMGDTQEVLRFSLLLRKVMLENDVKPIRSMLLPIAQLPVFLSFFLALRGMAQEPIESMKTGGFLWFTDITVPDPYYLLPLVTSCTLFLTLELGAEGGFRPQNMPYMKYIMRVVPAVVFFFSIRFQAALLCYWCTTNFVSLIQVGILRIPSVRKYFDIEKVKPPPPKDAKTTLKMKLKDSWQNQKMMNEIEDRIRMDAFNFNQAGMGPIPKTFPTDPTQGAVGTDQHNNKEPLMVGSFMDSEHKGKRQSEPVLSLEQRNLEMLKERIKKRN